MNKYVCYSIIKQTKIFNLLVFKITLLIVTYLNVKDIHTHFAHVFLKIAQEHIKMEHGKYNTWLENAYK